MACRLNIVLLFVALFTASYAVGGTIGGHNLGTTQCNGNNVTLNYQGQYHSGGSGSIPFSVNVSVNGAAASCQTVDGITYAVYSILGSPVSALDTVAAPPVTIDFSAPIVPGDATAYNGVVNHGAFPFGDFNYYLGDFSFTDTTTGITFSSNYVSVASTMPILDGFQLPNDQSMTFDPSGVLVVWANSGAPNVTVPTPEPGTLALLGSALGSLAVLRRKFFV